VKEFEICERAELGQAASDHSQRVGALLAPRANFSQLPCGVGDKQAKRNSNTDQEHLLTPRKSKNESNRPRFEITRGHPLPFGSSLKRDGVNFSVFSRHATGVTLVIFPSSESEQTVEFQLDPRFNRTGDIWHAFVRGLDAGVRYGFRAERLPNTASPFHRYDPTHLLIDPYSTALSGGKTWGESLHLESYSVPGQVKHRRSLVVEDTFDWEDEQPLNTHLADSIIYEMHVRGFTQDRSSGVKTPGTFSAVVEKIPYLKELGITAVELMPITEFEENDNPRRNSLTGTVLKNFWGYHPISFFAPKAAYAADGKNPMVEFKRMVKALHEAGIEVILDMVFNHTAEGDERGPTLCFRGLDNKIYYLLDPETGKYRNYSGCGNTLNCNHPVIRWLILHSLRYWVTEMHVDGFRFDLASILGRGTDGSVLANPPLLEAIAGDPVLANTKLIAEAWDAAGLYQVGTFPNWGRWAEWNGKFRDDVRRFVKSDANMVPMLATRMAGSADLYQVDGRAPFHSINFVTSHDGFTLMDLVSYNEKHNEANGENGADGSNENHSWNCGEEGPSSNPAINRFRKQQIKNFVTILLLSQGVPMILAGDEFGRTQQGNNNPYCQDNEISWLNWRLLRQNHDLFRFFKELIAFRKAHAILRRRTFQNLDKTPDFLWHGVKPLQPDWGWHSRFLGMQVVADKTGSDLLIYANAYEGRLTTLLPVPSRHKKWLRFVDTALTTPHDIRANGKFARLAKSSSYDVAPHSVVVLISS
jgi:isoamylase